MARIVGPLDTYDLADGTRVPFYVLRYDKHGICTTPKSFGHLVDVLEGGSPTGPYTDVYVFSHGWNTTPQDAIENYRRWIAGYMKLRTDGGYGFGRDYRPLLVGVVWPSVWIVPWWERGPKIAAAAEDPAAEEAMVVEIAELVRPDRRQRFYELAETPALREAEAREFLELAGPLYAAGDVEAADSTGPEVDDLMAAWARISAGGGGDSEFVAEDVAAPVVVGGTGDTAGPAAAGAVGRAPIDGIRMLSVWQMKDRAGVVGNNGVADLLHAVLTATGAKPGGPAARTHLIGHSFGTKVLLTALCKEPPVDLPRNVSTVLMLQAAINHFAFAADVAGTGKEGGFRRALTRVDRPILTTFTKDDKALRWFFHQALRRGTDLGEAQFAGDEPPSNYAAMGGYGPHGLAETTVVDARDPGHAYDLGPVAPEVVGVRAHGKITGHGDIANDTTYWALYSLVKES